MNRSFALGVRRLTPLAAFLFAGCASSRSEVEARPEAPAATADRGGEGRRYDVLGLRRVSRATPSVSFRGATAPQYRGVFVGLKNDDAVAVLRGATIVVQDGGAAIFSGGGVRDADDVPLAGATARTADDGRTLITEGLAVPPGGWAHLWIDLSSPPPTAARFEVTASY